MNGTVVGASSLVTSTVRGSTTSMSTSTSESESEQQSVQAAGPVGNTGLLGGSANLPVSGTVGSAVVGVTGTPIGTPTATAKLQDASSEAGKGVDKMKNLVKLALAIAVGVLVL